MDIQGSIVLQALLLGLAFAITVLRCWVRLHIEHRTLTISDYFIWAGWACTLGWFICSVKALNLQKDHPLDEDGYTDSVDYLTTVYVSCFFFDIGLYMPKASILAFYWWLIPRTFRRLRVSLYIGTAFMVCCGVASVLTDLLLAIPISDNWCVFKPSSPQRSSSISNTGLWKIKPTRYGTTSLT
ncbi:hypothetical protein K491DRAFT_330516 [Lophiostoma macrostomum CBS 122681]|uniref:Rhodopsin domain-containing protein n=1 Tax=Lophiostoma macrostomum CBS 122681 TaxID=1314788 RepID=A0A6A6TFC6_9PLEO|nr:hypothetical protein K491DRAFT_330516 [Lophiostoma macrostomum CBS 122681]